MSDVWKYFVLKHDDPNKASCKLCNVRVSRGGKNSRSYTTTNLRVHLKSNHLIQFRELEKKRLKTAKKNVTSEISFENTPVSISTPLSDDEEMDDPRPSSSASDCSSFVPAESNSSTPKKTKFQPSLNEIWRKPYTEDDPRRKKISNLIGRMLAENFLSFKLVQSNSFIDLIKYLEPRYAVPCRQTFSRRIIPILYNKACDFVKHELEEAETVACTTDFWSSNSGDDYLSLTVHFITKEFVKKNLFLEVVPFSPVYHTSENISEFLVETLDSWKIKRENIHLFLRDNAFNMAGAFILCGIPSEGCAAHTLQLVVREALLNQTSISNVCTKVRKVVAHFRHSLSANKLRITYQENNNLPVHKLIQDQNTRWDSTFLMLERFVEQKKMIKGLAPTLNISNIPSNEEWQLIENVVPCLQLFRCVTLEMSEEGPRSSIANVIPLIGGLIAKLNAMFDKDTNHPKSFGQSLIANLRKRFKNIENNHFYAVATLMDPRFKGFVFSSPESVEKAKKQIINIMKDSFKKKDTSLEILNSIESTVDCPSLSLYNIILPQIKVSLDNPEDELEDYLQKSLLPIECDPLIYWKNCKKYVHLSDVAKIFLAAPCGSVASERFFSAANLVSSKTRGALNPNKVKQLVFLAKNKY